MIEWVKPTVELIELIAADMRQADIDEVWASDHHTPIEALTRGWDVSDLSVIGVSSGEPLVMIGLVKGDLLSGHGVVWMLGTNGSMKHRKEFLKQTGPIISEMLNVCSRLCNMVHSKNINSIRWLKWLGFTIEEPTPYGPDGDLFHQFYLERLQ